MSLYVEIGTEDEWLATVTATRITSAGEHPDAINTYEIRVGTPGPCGQYVGQIVHRYGDGAATLAHKTLAFWEENR